MPLARYMRPTIAKLGMLTMVTSLSGGGSNTEPQRTYVQAHGADAKNHKGLHIGHKHGRRGQVIKTEGKNWTGDGERYRGPDPRPPRQR
jgi:hypothetical protein